mgnify:FL=1
MTPLPRRETQPEREPEPSVWTVPPPDDDEVSQVNLRLSLDDTGDEPRTRVPVPVTGPVPAVVAAPSGDGLKLAGGSLSIIAVLALIDKALEGTGLTATQLVQQLGPALGPVYMASPIVGALGLLTWLLLRAYRREQSAHRRRDQRMQEAFVSMGRGVKTEIGKLRSDIRRVEDRFEVRVAEAVSAAVVAAAQRADKTDAAIADLRAGQVEINFRLGQVERRDDPEPNTPRSRRRGKEI